MTKPLRIAFMGSPDFAVPVLAALVEAGHEIACVYSQPPRPAGRGKKLRPTPVHRWAEARSLDVRTPRSLKKPPEQEAFAALELDAAVVVAYGLILPQAVLDAPRLGCMNMHASLLPRWRGAAPIHRAIMAGDEMTGVQAMMMEAGLDTGPVLATEETRIFPFDTTGSVHDRLAGLAADLAVTALDGLATGALTPQSQPENGVTYAHKVTAEDQRIDWSRPAAAVDCQIRGLSPFPGAWFHYTPAGASEPLRMKALMSKLEPGSPGAHPGKVLDDELLVQCGDGQAVRLLKAQKPGAKAMEAEILLRGLAIPAGAKFE
ncbi:MAG: methionyl-tRNA formyltransferase [Henriciella sp.]|nr:methionyl-tRNA formyltransferase [Henriciella sp.]